MNFKNKSLGINSALIIISSTIIFTVLHESAHFIIAEYFGLDPDLHRNYVHLGKKGSEIQEVIVAAAGPLFSLVSGTIITYVSIGFIKPSLFKLFLLWLGMGSILECLGYILIAPFAKNGDTGKVFDYLGIPTSVAVLIAVVSFLFIRWLFAGFSNQFIFYKNESQFNPKENQGQLFLYPVLVSIGTMLILTLPVLFWINVLPVVFMPLAYLSVRRRYIKLDLKDAELVVDRVFPTLIILTVISVIAFRLLA